MVKVILAKDGILAGRKFIEFKSKYGLPIGATLLKTTEDALANQNLLDTTYEFRGFVKYCLRKYQKEHGLKATLKLTGLSKSAYYRGLNSDRQRFDSKFNKYLKSLAGVEIVFDALHNISSLAKEGNYEN